MSAEQSAVPEQEQPFVIRYVITHIGGHGFRTLARPQQGRFTYASEREAQRSLDAIVKHTDPELLDRLYGLPMEVRPCKCYPGHFDPIGVVFD